MVKNITGIYAGSKIPHKMRTAIEHAITNGSYLNISNFIRDAIKEKLQREGFIAVKKSGGRNSETKL
jgi:Arc/MetJ-type ribon-helix-helix transcriptional regulator